MSCKSALYGANSSTQEVALNGVINFGSPVRRFGCNCCLSGGNAIVNGIGYYDVTANITLEAATASTVTVTLYKDGVAVPGANVTITAAAGDIYAVTIPAIIRQVCNCESVITAVLGGAAGSITNAAIKVEKL